MRTDELDWNNMKKDGGIESSKQKSYIPYGRQSIEDSDIDAVIKTLNSNYLTTGPRVAEFEKAIADYCGVKYALAVSSGTAALHCAIYALSVESGDEVILPTMTFAATANSVCFQGGLPVFVDVLEDTLLVDPNKIEEKITKKTKAIIGVDYAGQTCDWDRLKKIASKYGIALIADSCHALGAEYKKRKTGSLADMSVFSFHPVKHIATGEGGMVTTNNGEFAEKIKLFRNHGITTDYKQREQEGEWFYEMVDLGFNYRLTDIQCALGLSQLKRLPAFLKRRHEIAKKYDKAFENIDVIDPLLSNRDCLHAYHLYVIQIKPDCRIKRNEAFKAFRELGIGVNVHYIPVHLHPYYQNKFGYSKGFCPVAEKMYERILSLPIWPGMTDKDVNQVIETTTSIFGNK